MSEPGRDETSARPRRAAGGGSADLRASDADWRPTARFETFIDDDATVIRPLGRQPQYPGLVAGEAPPAEATEGQPAAVPEEPSLARSSAIMAAGSMVSRVLGLVRTSLLTAVVGVSLANDAFAVANSLPNYVFMLLSAGLLNAVLIPQITRAMRQDDEGRDFIDRLVTVSIALVVGVALLATVLAPWLVSATSDLSGASHHLAVLFAYICLPQIAFYGLYAVLGQVLNARNQFAAFMWSPVLANVVQIVGLVYFLATWHAQADPRHWTSAMVWVLAGTTTLGIVLQGLFLAVPLWRGGFRWRPRLDLRGSGLHAASRMAAWSFVALLVSIAGGLVIQKVLTAVRDRPGNEHIVSVAGQQLAFLIFMIPHAFITTSILTALFPRMSRAVHDGDEDGLRGLVRRGMTMPAVAVIPASVALAVLAVPVIRLLFSMRAQDSLVVGQALAIMSLGTLAFGLTTLQQRYCFAREDGRLNLWLQVLVTGGQVAIGLVALVAAPQHAVLWAAAGQTIGNTVAAVAYLVVAGRQLGDYGLGGVVRLWARLGIASVLAAAASGWVAWGLGHLGGTRSVQLIVLLVAGVLFLGVFWVMAQLLRITEVDDFLAPILRRLPGRRAAAA
ncbi:MAG TPA: murein biosynthesis integral membrane protein MurJ [Propionibacteriaceae bacterium]|nr:murein biosynthesis integral membrane protein MurJ [Propionibacteriaceae bacterium]